MNNQQINAITLNEILKKKRDELDEVKRQRPLNELKKIVADQQRQIHKEMGNKRFLKSLKDLPKGRVHKTKIIAEIKRASPVKGILREEFDPEQIAKTYEKHGASAISVLTTRFGFEGDIDDLNCVKRIVNIPVLRKDFIFDEYQIYESQVYNADAILLIASILEETELKGLFSLAFELGIESLIETHSLEDISKAINCNADIIGINNRNLKTFEVDLNTTLSLVKEIPKDKVVVSESGIKTREDILMLERNGVNAFLIGTTLMRCNDIGKELDKLLGQTGFV